MRERERERERKRHCLYQELCSYISLISTKRGSLSVFLSYVLKGALQEKGPDENERETERERGERDCLFERLRLYMSLNKHYKRTPS
jgi:hypothetical protein